MITAPVPTRAEVSDVATAVFEGADAIMLSAESAAGQYPVEAVETMNRIAERVEDDPNYAGIINAQRSEPEATGADAIAAAGGAIAGALKLAEIMTDTAAGTAGLSAARERPQVPIIALSPILNTARRLSLLWGTHCVVSPDASDLDDMVNRACRIALEEGFGKPGDRVIITAGVPLRTPGSTNMLRIAYVGRARRRPEVDLASGAGLVVVSSALPPPSMVYPPRNRRARNGHKGIDPVQHLSPIQFRCRAIEIASRSCMPTGTREAQPSVISGGRSRPEYPW